MYIMGFSLVFIWDSLVYIYICVCVLVAQCTGLYLDWKNGIVLGPLCQLTV